MRNDGRSLQNEIVAIAQDYERRGIARICKVDPPVRLVGTGRARRTIFLENPFVDFIGTWAVRAGRTICLEAKETSEPTLPINRDGGLTERQWQAILHWELAGAACGVLWRYGADIRMVPVPAIHCQLRASTRHVKWEHATPIPRGFGFVTYDFLHTLGEYYPLRA